MVHSDRSIADTDNDKRRCLTEYASGCIGYLGESSLELDARRAAPGQGLSSRRADVISHDAFDRVGS